MTMNDSWDIWKVLLTVFFGVASLAWTIYAWHRSRQDKEIEERRQNILTVIFEKEDRQSREIETLKKTVIEMQKEFYEMKMKFTEDSTSKREVLKALRDYVKRMDSTIEKHAALIESYGKVIFKDK